MEARIVSNKKFAEEDQFFQALIEKANERGFEVKATKRQVSKFRNKKGTAFHHSKAIPKKKKAEE